VLTFAFSSTPQVFALTPSSPGTVTLTPTNNGGLTNPSAVTYTVTVSPTLWSYLSTVSGFAPSLLGSVAYTVYRCDGSTYSARTTTGVVAMGAAAYAASVSIPTSGSYCIQWDDSASHYAYDTVSPLGVEPSSSALPGGLNLSQAVSEILAAVVGIVSGYTSSGNSTPVFLAPDGITARITGTVDSSGNRTISTLSPPL
jgi:hypothetical protein